MSFIMSLGHVNFNDITIEKFQIQSGLLILRKNAKKHKYYIISTSINPSSLISFIHNNFLTVHSQGIQKG